MSNTYNISEVASKLGLSTKTLRRWEEAGKFKGGRTEGGQRRYSLGDVHILDAIKAGLVTSHKELLTKEQVNKEFGIDTLTLDDWENKGQILPLVTADGIFYPQKDVINKLKSHLAHSQPQSTSPNFTLLRPVPQNNSYPQQSVPTAITAFTAPTAPTYHLTHHDFWVLFLLNLLVTLTLVLLYHVVTLP